MSVIVTPRRGRKFFSDRIEIRDPLVPSLDHLAQDARVYEGLLAQPLLDYFRSEFPFQATIKWTFKTSTHGEEETQHRHSASIRIRGGLSPQRALTTFVSLLLQKYRIILESVEGSGWTVSSIPLIDIYTTPAARARPVGSAGTWIPTPKELANKRCTFNLKSPVQGDSRCFQDCVLCGLTLQQNPDLPHPEHMSHYITNIPKGGRLPANWAPIRETLGLDFSMMRDGYETSEDQINLFEERNPDVGVVIYDRKTRKTPDVLSPSRADSEFRRRSVRAQ